ncbi:MAG: pirin family protein [Crocinitomicaceae bacterium]|nr:pirin family protein [Crocinitomicaceae bacterium]
MKITHIKANDRGHMDHGWLNAHHMFNFANYYHPDRMGFGSLRVLNDDIIQGGTGFPTHPHNNMEIITVPLEGALEHKDSMGNEGVIKSGEVQVMSAGTGVLHSEANAHAKEATNITQIWVIPNKKGVEPRYDQIKFSFDKNVLQQIVSPNEEDAGSWIHSNSWFNHGVFEEGETFTYELHTPENGLFVFLIDGQLDIKGNIIEPRDGFGIEEADSVEFQVKKDSRFLLMEVPMNQ